MAAEVPRVALSIHVAPQPQIHLVELIIVRAVVERHRPIAAIARAKRIDRDALVEPTLDADAVESSGCGRQVWRTARRTDSRRLRPW